MASKKELPVAAAATRQHHCGLRQLTTQQRHPEHRLLTNTSQPSPGAHYGQQGANMSLSCDRKLLHAKEGSQEGSVSA
jgi:hypothetical protein